jgi:hypothetical protein
MKVKWGGLIVEGRGKLGDVVYSRNAAGAYAHINGYTPQEPTAYQEAIQDMWRAAVQAWQSLTDPQRLAWIKAAESVSHVDVFGDNHPLNGYQFHCQRNFNRQLLGLSNLSLPPSGYVSAVIRSLVSLTASVSGGLIATIDPALPSSDYYLIVRATPLNSIGSYSMRKTERIIDVIGYPSTTTLDLTSAYTTRFGSLAQNKRIFVAISSLHGPSGQSSPYLVLNTIVGA